MLLHRLNASKRRKQLQTVQNEIDMVVHLGWVKEKQYDLVTEEIKQVKRMCSGRVLKVIIETCLLTVEEKIRMCEVVCKALCDYIKTSTGFSKTGATFEDVVLLKQNVLPSVKVKAAGGIRTFADAQKFLELGASRLGTSTLIKQIEREREKIRLSFLRKGLGRISPLELHSRLIWMKWNGCTMNEMIIWQFMRIIPVGKKGCTRYESMHRKGFVPKACM